MPDTTPDEDDSEYQEACMRDAYLHLQSTFLRDEREPKDLDGQGTLYISDEFRRRWNNAANKSNGQHYGCTWPPRSDSATRQNYANPSSRGVSPCREMRVTPFPGTKVASTARSTSDVADQRSRE
eukprot:851833-Heterocapsa_arctica.AAC.1